MQLTFTNRLFVFQPHDINTITVSSCAGMMSSHISACAAHVSTAESVMEGASRVLLFLVHVERILRVSSSVLVRADVQSSGSNSLAPHCKEIQLLHTSQINRERGKRARDFSKILCCICARWIRPQRMALRACSALGV